VEEGLFYAWLISGEIQASIQETREQCVHTTVSQLGMNRSEWRMRMKTYRLVTLFAAVLITVSLTRVLSHERVGDPQAQSPVVATANAP
jgi:mRNA-degrading endonuclease RelE of RelBE toxin-antitoxin system